eukprot:PhM_4_TR18601/c0_g6_i2/m.30917
MEHDVMDVDPVELAEADAPVTNNTHVMEHDVMDVDPVELAEADAPVTNNTHAMEHDVMDVDPVELAEADAPVTNNTHAYVSDVPQTTIPASLEASKHAKLAERRQKRDAINNNKDITKDYTLAARMIDTCERQ